MKIAIANYGHTAPLKDGSVPIEGVAPDYVKVEPQIAAFRRMVRDVEFDACELAATTYIIARAYGAPFIALPIILGRRFHHEGIVCRADANIRTPKDLEGKKVGVRAYSVTTGVWTRGILINEYGLDNSKVTWVVDDEEHVTQLKLPSNVIHVKPGESLVDLMEKGELQAGFTAAAGIGRKGAPKEGWQANAVAEPSAQQYHDLIPDAQPIEFDWYRRTGIYPMHGVLVVKEKLLKDNPWLAKSLYTAFSEAKARYLTKLRSGEANKPKDLEYKKFSTVVGDDPLPFGVKPNLPTIEALIKYATQQGLVPRTMRVEELFYNPEA
jgi:4,5-dihydroxyphthalate decarboxylase